MIAQTLSVRAGASTDFVTVPGCMLSDVTSHSSNVTIETDLASLTVPAKTFNADGDTLIIRFSGESFDSLSNTIKIYVDGTLLLSFFGSFSTAGYWWGEVWLSRKDSATLRVHAHGAGWNNLLFQWSKDQAVTLTSSFIVKLTSTIDSGSGATPYTTEYVMLANYIPAA